MSGTRRTPIARIGAPLSISARALELFKATERARRRRRGAACVVNTYGLCRMECPACQAWSTAHDELHREFALKPWQWPCLPICPHPPGTQASREWEPSGLELALWQTLERARRAALAVSAAPPEASIRSESYLGAEIIAQAAPGRGGSSQQKNAPPERDRS
jgi:hypothetical protein